MTGVYPTILECLNLIVNLIVTDWSDASRLRYFNKAWNRTWTHGIPHHDCEDDGAIGPRISIALLCAEADFTVPYRHWLACSIEIETAASLLFFLSNTLE